MMLRDGARYNRLAFDRMDIGRVIDVKSVPENQMFAIETSGGIIRTESHDFGGGAWPGLQ